MTESSKHSEFYQNLPAYVETAHAAARSIFMLALQDPRSNIQIRATVYGTGGYETDEHTTNLSRIAELIHAPRGLKAIDADIPLDGMRLALEKSVNGRNLRVWRYAVPNNSPDYQAADPNWIASTARSAPSNLVAAPGYIFSKGSEYALSDFPPTVTTYTHTQYDAANNHDTYCSARGVGNTSVEGIKAAIAPRITRADERLLAAGVEAYHSAKIHETIQLLGHIARQG